MFSFLSRNKSLPNGDSQNSITTNTSNQQQDEIQTNQNGEVNSSSNSLLTEKPTQNQSDLKLELEDARKNLIESINIKRTDILVSIINEWLKSKSLSVFKSNFLRVLS
jgi:hypothetical protein